MPGAGEAGRLPLRVAVGDGRPLVLRPLPRLGGGARNPCLRPRQGRPRARAGAAAARVSRRPLHEAGAARAARRSGVRAHSRRGRADREGARQPLAATPDGVLPRRRADPGDPALPRWSGATAVSPGDDGGRAVGAQHPRPRHSSDLRRALRQRGGARPQCAHPSLPRRQRNPPNGGPGARASGRGRGLYPERSGRGVRAARADASRVPARRRCGARGHHLRGAGRRRGDAL